MNNKAQNSLFSNYIFLFILFGILILVIFLFYAISLISVPTIGVIDTISTSVQQASVGDAELNENINNTIVPLAQSTHNVEWIGYGSLVFFFMGYLLILSFIRVQPFLIVVWIVLVLIAVFIGIYISDSYNNIRNQDVGSIEYSSWQTNDFILSNLPIVIACIGFIGGIILFVLITRDGEGGTDL